jgi:hypothetical protein
MNTRSITSLFVVAVAFALAGCKADVTGNNGAGSGMTASQNASLSSAYVSTETGALGIADQLRVHGLTVNVSAQESFAHPMFPAATAYQISVNGQTVQAYEYATEQAAQADAGSISPDGGTVGNVNVSWVGQPHFYRKGNVTLLYLGNNPTILEALDDAAGPQFAGVRSDPEAGTGSTL